MKFEPIETDFDNQNWKENYLKRISTKVDDFFETIDSQKIQECNNNLKLLLKHEKEYQVKHNEFLYFWTIVGIPFGLLLFIYPGILLIRKYKELKKNKKSLIDNVDTQEENVIKANKNLLSNFDLYLLIKDIITNDLEYKDYGPINESLVNEIKALSMFDLKNSNDFNTYNSSWGSFNNNIVINRTYLKHSIFNKVYTGTKTVFYKKDGKTYSDVVTASFSHPCVEFKLQRKLWCFTEYVPELEFSFSKTHNNRLFNKKDRETEFENPIFEKKYSWSYNNEAQIRMVFTPYFQENFLRLNNNSEPKSYYKLMKKSSFFSNESNCSNLIKIKSQSVKYFLSNPQYNFETFKEDIKKEIIHYLYSWYINLSFMTIIPIIQSEDQTPIIKKILSNNNQCTEWEIHYVISGILNQKLIKRDTDTMHVIKNINIINHHDLVLYDVDLNAYSYDAIKKVKYIPTMSRKGMVQVPVDYIDYRKQEAEGKIIFCKTPNKDFYFNYKRSNANNLKQISDQIKEITKSKNIIIKNGYIAIMTSNDVDSNSIVDLFYELSRNLRTKSEI